MERGRERGVSDETSAVVTFCSIRLCDILFTSAVVTLCSLLLCDILFTCAVVTFCSLLQL